MSAEALEVEEQELKRGRAEPAEDPQQEPAGGGGRGDGHAPPPPDREGSGGRGRRPPRWWKLELLALVLCIFGGLLGMWASALRRRAER
jgi:hypothetical protein